MAIKYTGISKTTGKKITASTTKDIDTSKGYTRSGTSANQGNAYKVYQGASNSARSNGNIDTRYVSVGDIQASGAKDMREYIAIKKAQGFSVYDSTGSQEAVTKDAERVASKPQEVSKPLSPTQKMNLVKEGLTETVGYAEAVDSYNARFGSKTLSPSEYFQAQQEIKRLNVLRSAAETERVNYERNVGTQNVYSELNRNIVSKTLPGSRVGDTVSYLDEQRKVVVPQTTLPGDKRYAQLNQPKTFTPTKTLPVTFEGDTMGIRKDNFKDKIKASLPETKKVLDEARQPAGLELYLRKGREAIESNPVTKYGLITVSTGLGIAEGAAEVGTSIGRAYGYSVKERYAKTGNLPLSYFLGVGDVGYKGAGLAIAAGTQIVTNPVGTFVDTGKQAILKPTQFIGQSIAGSVILKPMTGAISSIAKKGINTASPKLLKNLNKSYAKTIRNLKDRYVGQKTFTDTKLASIRVGESKLIEAPSSFTYKGVRTLTKPEKLNLLTGKAKATITQTKVGTGLFNKGKIYSTATDVKPVTFKLTSKELVNLENKLKLKNVSNTFDKKGNLINFEGTQVYGKKAFSSEPLSFEKAENLSQTSFFRTTGKINIGGKSSRVYNVSGTSFSGGKVKLLLVKESAPVTSGGVSVKTTTNVFAENGDYVIKSGLGKKTGSVRISGKSYDTFENTSPTKFSGVVGQSEVSVARRSIVKSNLNFKYYEGAKVKLKQPSLIGTPPSGVKPKQSLAEVVADNRAIEALKKSGQKIVDKVDDVKPSIGGDVVSSPNVSIVRTSGGQNLLLKQKVEIKPAELINSVEKPLTKQETFVKSTINAQNVISKNIAKNVNVYAKPSFTARDSLKQFNTFSQGASTGLGVFSSFGKGKLMFANASSIKPRISENYANKQIGLFKQKSLLLPKLRSNVKSITDSASDLGQKIDSLTRQKVNVGEVEAVRVNTNIDTATNVATGTQTNTGVRVRELTLPKTIFKPRTRINVRPFIETPPLPKPKLFPIFMQYPTLGKGLKLGSRRGFSVFVRKKGKKLKVGSNLPLGRATSLGVKVTGFTAARSFVVAPEGFTSQSDVALPNLSQYRVPKFGGRVQRQGFEFVEKSKFAIDTIGEKKEITYAPRPKISLRNNRGLNISKGVRLI